MAASLKVSELSALSSVAAADLLLIADSSATASKKVTLTNLEGSISLANLGTRAISDLSNVASTAPSSGQVLAYNGSAWAPAANTTKADLDVDHLITLSGVSAAADDLGTFTGSTIADSATVKTALQSLETAVESASSAAATVSTTTRSTDATHFLTFVDSDNSSSAEEAVYTDAGIAYNPSSNLLTVGEVSATTLDIGGTNVTATAAELNILDGVTSTAAELNILDGVTSTTAELNILDGVTSTAAELNILDGVTSTTAELNILDGVTATTTELNYVDGVTSNVQTQLDAKQATVTAGDGLAFSGATLAVDLSEAVVANETLTLSGMSDSDHDGTYSMVYRSGTRLLATADQSGADIVISIDREAEFSLSVSGTSVSAIDNGGSLTVQKHTGYLTNSGDVWTWATGSDASDFHWYYWDTTDDILVAWDGTNDEWKAFDLGEATGNVASFISDLDSTGSSAGYVAAGENFTLTSGNIASLTSNNDTYPGTLIIKVPDAADSNITYGSASSHPYYVYQSSDAKKWILFTLESPYYWTAWYRSTAFDLTTETLTDDATAFTLDNVAHFEFITTASDTYNSNNIPDADSSNVTYATAASGAYLEIASNKLQAKVKDEDDMSSDSQDHVPTQQSVKAYVDANEVHIDNLVALSGVAKDAANLGTFSGTTISDSVTVKAALQALETELESTAGGGAQAASLTTVTRATDATHYLTFVQDDNGSATQETFHTDAGVVYNPSSNLLTVGALTISGDLTVQGTTTNISSTTITVDDKNIELGAVDTPSDTTADGGGITLKGATDKTINWINSTDNWTASESFDLVSGKEYKIANASVLSATTLGSAVVASSLTSVGTLTALAVSGTANFTGTFQLGSTSVTASAAELNILDGVTSTATELNRLDGITSSTAELNILDGVTATAGELNILDGVTSTATELNILDGVTATTAELNILDGVTSTAAELNILDGVTSTAAELNLVDGITAGTIAASKAVIVDSNKDITGFRNVTLTGELDAATGDFSGDIDVAGTTNLDAVDIDGDTDLAGDLTFSAAKDIQIIDNNAAALEIAEAGNNYMVFDTRDGAEKITLSKATTFASNVTFEGDLTISGQHDISMDDNTAAAIDFKEGSNSYLKFDTTDGSELITFSERLKLAGNAVLITFDNDAQFNVPDNSADALDIMYGSSIALRLETTDDAEKFIFYENILIDTGKTFGFDDHGSAQVDRIQGTGTSFADNDTSLMTSAAIQDKVQALVPTANGTFTAQLEGSTGNPGSKITSTAHYARSGDLVQATIYFNNVDTSSYSGAISISGLPIQAKDTAGGMFMGNVHNVGMISGANDSVTAIVSDNGTTVVFVENSSTTALNWGTVGTGKTMRVQVQYIAA